MSLLIQNMDMPKSCKDCDIKRDISGWYCCTLGAKDGKPLDLENIYDELIYIDSRHPDCPLVEIPTPHGRLIDADELMKECEKEPTFLAEMLHRKLRNAPTIIEAEED